MKAAGAAGYNLTLHEKNPQTDCLFSPHASTPVPGDSTFEDRVGDTPLFLRHLSSSCTCTPSLAQKEDNTGGVLLMRFYNLWLD